MMNKSRQQFEEWSDGKDLYNISPFDIWKASRDSLLLHLPVREKSAGNYDYFTDGYNSGISACETALLDNGVKIKNE
ncbi:hypothetical protein ACN3ZE_003446 [Providencia rettgeri]